MDWNESHSRTRGGRMSDGRDAAKQQEQAENGSLKKDAGESEQNMYTSVQPYRPRIERSRRMEAEMSANEPRMLHREIATGGSWGGRC